MFVLVLVVTAVLQTTVMAVRPFVSYRALDLGAGAAELGLIASSFAVLAILVTVPIGRWIDRRGERSLLLLGTVVTAASSLGMLLVTTMIGLAVLNAVLGMGRIMWVIGGQSTVANVSPPGTHDRRFGFFSAVVSVGQAAGPALAAVVATPLANGGGLFALQGTHRVFLLAGLATLLAVPAILLMPAKQPQATPEAGSPTQPRPAIRELLRRPAMIPVIWASMAVMAGVDLLVTFLPALGEQLGLPVAVIGTLLSVRSLSALASRLGAGTFVRWWGLPNVLAGSLVLAGIALALLPFTSVVPILVALMVANGFGLGLGQPLSLSWISQIAPDEGRATALALRLLGNRFAQLVIPPVVGAVGAGVGLAGLFVLLAAWLVGSGGIVRVRGRAV